MRKDGLCFLVVSKKNTIDVIKPTEDDDFKRVKLIEINSQENNQIYISERDENCLYLRSLVKVYKSGDRQELPEDISKRKDIEIEKDIYHESIKKLKFTFDNSTMLEDKFDGVNSFLEM